MKTMTQTTLEQLVAECSQDENVLAILTYEETPNVVQIICYQQLSTADTTRVQYAGDTLAAIDVRSLQEDDDASRSPSGALRVISL
ncbi:MAG: hypothetical protein KC496_07905, partial [Anaerolineae bacterium]|nr:hypothetical protein [Anaerolineae bacterium]